MEKKIALTKAKLHILILGILQGCLSFCRQSLLMLRNTYYIFKQLIKLDTLSFLWGKDIITHPGPGYYGKELSRV